MLKAELVIKLKNFPEIVYVLQDSDMEVLRIKFLSDGAYFIADKNGSYEYSL